MKYQFMPMFWGDFFANTLHLSTHEVGAYVLLIAHAWEHEGKIPYADAMRIARVNPWHWPKVWKQLEPFFEWDKDPTVDTPLWGTHSRVLQELSTAAEISNKRKAAALQKHSKSSANGGANDPHLHLQLPIDNLSGVREGAPPSVQMQVDFHDKGNDYRSPPAAKTENVLVPIPDRPPPKLPEPKQAAEKRPSSTTRAELDAYFAARRKERDEQNPPPEGIRRP